jgi:hypothetical protein
VSLIASINTYGSTLFNPLHPPGTLENNLSPESYKGRVDPEITAIAAAKQNAERARIASARAALAPVETILGIDEFEVCDIESRIQYGANNSGRRRFGYESPSFPVLPYWITRWYLDARE